MNATTRVLLVALLLSAASSDVGLVRGTSVAAAKTAGQSAPQTGADVVRIGVLRNGSYEVVTLPMEVYVSRVLAGEAAPESPPAALESLAIAIRTYTITNRGRHASEGFDLCDQTHCQVMRKATAATERAALASTEQVLLYRDAPATVFYSASCGGRSEKPSDVWPTADDPPYLSIHDDDGCGGFPTWSAELADADLQRAFRAGGFKGRLRAIRVTSRNESGRVATLALDGLTPHEISGQDLRMVVGRTLGFQHIQSAQFDLRRTGRAFRFTGRGAGHGVGLCVIGSMKLAGSGQSAAAILARYFPGTRIGPFGPRISNAPPERPTLTAPLPRAVPPAPSPVVPRPAAPPSPPVATGDALPPSSPLDQAPQPTDIVLTLPPAAVSERAELTTLVDQQRRAVAAALGVNGPSVRLRVHDSNAAFERATARPWFAQGAVIDGEINLTPVQALRERGMLERTIRRQLVHLTVDQVLPAKPAWIREGAALHFAEPEEVVPAHPPCPQDRELQSPVSQGAFADALARARTCFDRQVAGGRDWRRVR